MAKALWRVVAVLVGACALAPAQPSIYEIASVVVQVVGASPALTLTQPSNLAYLTVSPVRVTGTVGTPGTPVTINGVPAVVTASLFTAQVPMLEGTNTLTAVAANGDGSVLRPIRCSPVPR